jgi:hypothetical protein
MTNGPLEEQLSFLKKLQWVGYSIIGAVLLAVHYSDFNQKIVAILSFDNGSLLALLQVLLGIFVIGLITGWVIYTAYESPIVRTQCKLDTAHPPKRLFRDFVGRRRVGSLGVSLRSDCPFHIRICLN